MAQTPMGFIGGAHPALWGACLVVRHLPLLELQLPFQLLQPACVLVQQLLVLQLALLLLLLHLVHLMRHACRCWRPLLLLLCGVPWV